MQVKNPPETIIIQSEISTSVPAVDVSVSDHIIIIRLLEDSI